MANKKEHLQTATSGISLDFSSYWLWWWLMMWGQVQALQRISVIATIHNSTPSKGNGQNPQILHIQKNALRNPIQECENG